MHGPTITGGRLGMLPLILLVACADDTPPLGTDPQLALERHPVVRTISDQPLKRPGRLTWAGPNQTFLMVTDHYQGTVFQFVATNQDLVKVREFHFGAGISGVAWGANRLFVGNTSTASVGVYGPSGAWMYDLGGPGTFWYPTDVEVDVDEDLVFVLDNRKREILRFHVDGTFRSSWKAVDLGMENPVAIGIDPVRQELLVSDYGALTYGTAPFALHIFDYEGTHLKMISGKAGMLGARFARPQGTTVDRQGRILLVDALSSRLLVIDRYSGATLATYGEAGTEPGQMLAPLDVAVDADGRAFVTNNRLGRIEVFQVGGGS